jgi:hypothetical protein
MSLSAHERRELDSISAGLAVSDPGLAGFLGTFTRLTASEVMPAHEQIAVRPARLLWRAGILTLVLIPFTALVAAVAVALSAGGLAPCRAPSMGCPEQVPSAAAHAGRHLRQADTAGAFIVTKNRTSLRGWPLRTKRSH